MLHVTFLLWNTPKQPKLLTCPEIARRIGRSRGHVARLAKQSRIPADRITTAGGHDRYELTPDLAEWMHKVRCPPRRKKKFKMEFFTLICRASRREDGSDTALVCEEMGDFVNEIAERVNVLLKRMPSVLTMRQLREALFPAIVRLMQLDLELKNRLPPRHRDEVKSQTTPEPPPPSQAHGNA